MLGGVVSVSYHMHLWQRGDTHRERESALPPQAMGLFCAGYTYTVDFECRAPEGVVRQPDPVRARLVCDWSVAACVGGMRVRRFWQVKRTWEPPCKWVTAEEDTLTYSRSR